MKSGYVVTEEPNPHIRRGAEIVRRYPDVKKLFGPHPISGPVTVAVVLFQMGMAWALSDASWLWILLAAYFIGAFASHCLFAMIHDTSHDLVGKTTYANKWWGIVCNIGQGFPSAIPFRTFHLLHHSNLDEYDYDGDLPFHWEARLVGDSPLRKSLWLFLFALVEVIRPLRLKKSMWNRWMVLNVAVVVATDVAIFLATGWKGLGYVLLSTIFGIGLHPVGARWIQEHYTFVPGQETYSYYGPLNAIALNIGYHNEHHDLPRVPWPYLPRVKAMAPEYYDSLFAHRSWTRVLLTFLFDRNFDLYTRITRERPVPQSRELAA